MIYYGGIPTYYIFNNKLWIYHLLILLLVTTNFYAADTYKYKTARKGDGINYYLIFN